MAVSSILFPCLSVFALSTVTPVAAASEKAAQHDDTVVVAALQDDADAPAAETPPAADSTTDVGSAVDAMIGDVDPMAEPQDLTAPAGPKPVFADLSDDQVFDRAVAYIQSIDTMRAGFVQTAPSGTVSTGTMELSRPGRLRFDYDDPNPTLVVATQGLVYVHDSDLETTDSYPVGRTPLKFLLAKTIDPADAQLVAVNRMADSVALTLESTDAETEGRIVLEFAAPEMALERWAVYDPRGGVTVVDLDAPETGVRIANNAFRVPEAGGSFLRDR